MKQIMEAGEEEENWETPRRKGTTRPKRIFKEEKSKIQKLSKEEEIEIKKYESLNIQNRITPEAGKIDLEFLLLNTLTITDLKVQEVSDKFLINKPYISIFCFTEIKVDCVDFIPIGIKIITNIGREEKRKEVVWP